jgi:phosphoribosylpyrophosphate synthetase
VPTRAEFPLPIQVSSLAPLLAETIQRLHKNQSISTLIGPQ